MKPIIVTNWACFTRGHTWKWIEHRAVLVCKVCHRQDTELLYVYSTWSQIKDAFERLWCWLTGKEYIPF